MRKLLFVLVALVFALPAQAAYPERAISIIVPLPPGGPADTVARVIGQRLSERLGQPVTIDNKPGALGLIGAEIGARAKPDGYTIVMVSSGLAIQVATQPKTVKFDVHKDLQPLTYAVKVPMVFAANPTAPFKTMKEFVDYAKTRPGALSVGVSPGLGGTAHLTLERMKLGVGLDVVAVPYKGSAPALQALLSNEVPVIIDTLAGMSGLIDDGKVRALAALTETAPVNHEKLPTIAAAGFEGYAADTWNGFMLPGGTPKEIAAVLHKEIVAILALPEVKEKILAVGLEPATNTPEQFTASFNKAVAAWTKLATDANLKFE
ncbi:MAG TPA: tripartite tricarboxylate transporter substrate-binding protein [Reyranella sp.]|nr:tripartite tricarboxylate transporter substrate-binding protein [Reyranella sp.]